MARIDAAIGPQTKGLFRTTLAGPGGTLRAAFDRLALAPGDHPRQVDPRWNVTFTRVDLPPDEGTGSWKLVSIRDEIFMVVTDCDYRSVRYERVPAEGLVEFHVVLEGPVELSVPTDREPTLAASTVMACHQAPGVSYDVVCLPGRFRVVSLYVRPELLADSFEFGRRPGSRDAHLMRPEPDAMAMLEAPATVEVVAALREVTALDVAGRGDLMLAMGRVFALLAHTAGLLSAPEAQETMFTQRELAMFARAQDLLSQDLAARQSIAALARRLGTNATKLKSGFKLLYGTTIFGTRHTHRMARAMEMLGDPGIPISTVSHEVGYAHQASFTTAFKAHFGLSPTEARKALVVKRSDPPA